MGRVTKEWTPPKGCESTTSGEVRLHSLRWNHATVGGGRGYSPNSNNNIPDDTPVLAIIPPPPPPSVTIDADLAERLVTASYCLSEEQGHSLVDDRHHVRFLIAAARTAAAK